MTLESAFFNTLKTLCQWFMGTVASVLHLSSALHFASYLPPSPHKHGRSQLRWVFLHASRTYRAGVAQRAIHPLLTLGALPGWWIFFHTATRTLPGDPGNAMLLWGGMGWLVCALLFQTRLVCWAYCALVDEAIDKHPEQWIAHLAQAQFNQIDQATPSVANKRSTPRL